MTRWVLASVLLASSLARAAESWTAPSDATAVDQPGGHAPAGAVKAGGRYVLLKRGGPGKAWCKLELPAGPGWVPCESSRDDGPRKAAFAYYVLSLSWSPAFCAEKGDRAPEQCGPGRRFGFVVHGLWPQDEKGWPESCGRAPLEPAVVDGMLDLMPSRALVTHEWEKHGTCSGMDAPAYFARVREARARVKVPANLERPSTAVPADLPRIERWFMDANPGLDADMIAVECARTVSEVRLCLDKELRFRKCGSDVKDRCRGDTVFPPLR